MFKQKDSSSREKMDSCFFQKLLRQNVTWLSLSLENASSKRFYFKVYRKTLHSSKMVLGIFETVVCSRDQHVFKRQSLDILNVFSTLTLKQVF